MDYSKILNRMVSGTYLIPYQNQIIFVRPASVDIRQRADFYYDSLIDTNKFSDCLRYDKLVDTFISQGLLDEDYQNQLDKNAEKIDQLKIQLFKCGPRITQAGKVRKELDIVREGHSRLNAYISKIRRNSLEGFAEHAKTNFLLMHTIYDDRGNLILNQNTNSIDSHILNSVMYHIALQTLDSKDLRAFARSGPWRSIWNADKQKAFINNIYELTEEQNALMHFSELYDFAYQNPKSPPDSILEDDDIFDGWYLNELKKMKSQKDEDDNIIGSPDPKYGEVYVMAQDQEEANSIYNFNSEKSKQILKDRANVMSKNDKVRDWQFKDVQDELIMQSNQKFREHVKKGQR